MTIAKCIEKHRDSNGNIIEYVLEDNHGVRKIVAKDHLKLAITNRQIAITNLKIDNAGRLVDKAPEEIKTPPCNKSEQPVSNPVQLQDILQRLSELEKSNQQYYNVLKVIYNRQGTAQAEHNNIMQMLNETEAENSAPQSIDAKLDSLRELLLNNSTSIEEMGTKVNELGTALQEISTSIDKDETSSKTFPMDGKLEPPADSYDKYWYSAFFDEERPGVEELDTNEEIRNFLGSVSFQQYIPSLQLSNFNISVDLLNEYKEEINKASIEYYSTIEFYEKQLNDYDGCIADSQLLATTMDILSSKFKDKTHIPLEVMPRLIKECTAAMCSNIPGLYNIGDCMKDKLYIQSEKKFTKGEASEFFKNVEGIWNCAANFLNTEQWEIKLYVIQTLNHLYMNTYSVGQKGVGGKGTITNVIENNNGNAVARTDASLFGRETNRLVENSLTEIFKEYEERNNFRDTQLEYIKQVYDRFVVAYFAGKQLMKKYNKIPFVERTASKINGALVYLICIGLLLTNVKEEVICGWINQFIYDNQNRHTRRYQIDLQVDLQSILR